MKQLDVGEQLPLLQRGAVAVQQIAVRAAEGVVNFGQHRNQVAGSVMAEPEADRIEHIAQHARKALQDNLAVGWQPVFTQVRLDPGQQGRTIAGAVVGAAKAQQIPPVHRKDATAAVIQRAQRQLHIEHRIDEGIHGRPHTPVHDMADNEARGGTHGRASGRRTQGFARRNVCPLPGCEHTHAVGHAQG